MKIKKLMTNLIKWMINKEMILLLNTKPSFNNIQIYTLELVWNIYIVINYNKKKQCTLKMNPNLEAY